MSTALQKAEDRAVEYIPLGQQSKLRLSVGIIQRMIAIPTRSGKTCSDIDALKFMALCQARKMNPFSGECFLQGYDTEHGPKFEFITAYQALIVRAELSPEFDGMRSGVIVRDNGKLADLNGDFYLDEQELLGAWGYVKRKDRSLPFEDRIKLSAFIKTTSKGEPMARWKTDAAGMLVKCAEASCLRRAFPTSCAGLHLREEISLLGEGLGVLPTPSLESAATEQQSAQPGRESNDNSNPELMPQKPGAPQPPDSPQSQLEAVATHAGISFGTYQRWGQSTKNDPEADSRTTWGEIPEALAKRFLRVKVDWVAQVKKFEKEGQ